VLAGSPGAGALVRWWLEHEAAGWTSADLFAAVLELADPPDDLIVLPYVHGRQAPSPDPSARLRVLGRHDAHTTPELAHAMLVGLCLHARWMLDEQSHLAGVQVANGPIAVLGRPILANPALLRVKRHVMPGPMDVVPSAEPVAAGAALVAAVRAGLVDPADALLDLQSEPLISGAGTDYDRLYAAFVAAATQAGDP
jgi:xylulokinase